MANFDLRPMTTARRPPQKPKPLQKRPLASSKADRNPITSEIMQRVRRVMREREITTKCAADEAKVSPIQFADWISPAGGAPYGDNLIRILRWLSREENDPSTVGEVCWGKTIKFRGAVDDIRTRKLSNAQADEIRASEEPGDVLAARYRVHPSFICRIRKGSRY